ncbi:MAG: hypothetical protein LBP52_07650 [Burkholderiaceae bacterium]|jgi:hypothetical protein|nr:hypothetical protein [Burkholderiaceae bacterium]
MTYRSQALASVVLGTPLTLALTGLYAQFGPGAPATNFIAALLLMTPIWLAVMVWTLKRTRGRTAWLGLGAANLVVYTAILLLKYLVFNGRT